MVFTGGGQLKISGSITTEEGDSVWGKQWTVSSSEQIGAERFCYKVLVTSFESLDPTVPEAGPMEIFDYTSINFIFFPTYLFELGF